MRRLALALAAMLALTACPGDPSEPRPRPSPPGPAPAGTIRLGYPAEPPTLDPAAPSGGAASTRHVLRPVLPALFRLTPEMRPEPELVADWPSPEHIRLDPFSVDVTLREARWSDGTPISAADVRFTWERLREGPTGGRYRSLTDVEVTGSRTFTLRFDRPMRRWWSLLYVDDAVLPAHAYSPQWASGPTVSGGPFRFEGWTPGLSIRLHRNDEYWGAKAAAEAIEIVFVADDETRILLLSRGELDAAYAPGDANFGARAGARGFPPTDGPAMGQAATTGSWGSAWWELDLDPEKVPEPLARAIAAALDRHLAPEMLEDSGQVMDGTPAVFPVPGPREWGLPAIGGPWEGTGGDIEAARRILREAGYRPGTELRDGRNSVVELRLAHPVSTTAGALGRLIHWQLRPLGLRTEVIAVADDRFHRDWLSEGRADAWLTLRHGSDAPDATAYRSDAPRPGRSQAPDGEIEAALSAGPDADLSSGRMVGLDPRAWTAVQRSLVAGGRVLPLARVRTWIAVRDGLVGPYPVGASSGPLWNAQGWGSAP